jgi:hypothetical protein
MMQYVDNYSNISLCLYHTNDLLSKVVLKRQSINVDLPMPVSPVEINNYIISLYKN